jgi:hypothetical protein
MPIRATAAAPWLAGSFDQAICGRDDVKEFGFIEGHHARRFDHLRDWLHAISSVLTPLRCNRPAEMLMVLPSACSPS